jgi:D-glutamate cyclase
VLYSQTIIDKINQLEIICGQDVGRGIQPLVTAAKGGLFGSASSIAKHKNPHVAIISGFYLPDGELAAAETDGIIGCVQVAIALARVGVMVRIVTDVLCFPAIKAAAFAGGIPHHVCFDIVPVDSPTSYQEVISLLNSWESMPNPVTHVISIERPGPSYDGIIRNMRGQDITAHTAPLHLLFNSLNHQLKKITYIGIGDGGNELGMGKIPKNIIHENIQYGSKIACVTSCNYLMVCGVSNWGGTALLLALSLLKAEWEPIIREQLNLEIELNILETIVSNKLAVDGVTGKASLSVDNLPWEYHAEVFQLLKQVIED